MTRTVHITATALTEQATERARTLVDVTAELAGRELTKREREIVMLGIGLGVSSCVAVLVTEQKE